MTCKTGAPSSDSVNLGSNPGSPATTNADVSGVSSNPAVLEKLELAEQTADIGRTLPGTVPFFTKYAHRIVVAPDGCWLWTGAKSANGYGWASSNVYAHRAAYEAVHGAGSAAGWLVRHKCDIRNCVNPDHLLIGTHADNARDMRERGRSLRGERQHMAKLRYGNIVAIRLMHAAGVPQTRIGARFAIDQSNVSLILSGRRWMKKSSLEDRAGLRAWLRTQPQHVRAYADFLPMQIWLAERYPHSSALRRAMKASAMRLAEDVRATR